MDQLLPYNYIVIEGNIGAGKTSLANIIANKFNTDLVLEQFADNTFLPQFYEQPERFGFPLEMSFLAERFQQISKAQEKARDQNKILVSDYLFEKSLLFARVTLKGGELELFHKFYKLINPALRKPDLILFLHKKTDSLIKNITKRGRSFEKEIQSDYLDRISEAYLEYLHNIDNQNIIILDADQMDFVNNHTDLRLILELITQKHPQKLQQIRF